MTIAKQLAESIASGVDQIGQIRILCDFQGVSYVLCHVEDEAAVHLGDHTIECVTGPDRAREISTWSEDQEYRFSKAQANLRRGWSMRLESAEELRQALDGFYPAAVGVWLAERNGSLSVQNLRDKLNRQTGMYRYARTISDENAQQLVRETCGPEHHCAKKILWKIDDSTALEESDASRFNGVLDGHPPQTAIPLLCREACNHFVAECRRVAKEQGQKK